MPMNKWHFATFANIYRIHFCILVHGFGQMCRPQNSKAWLAFSVSLFFTHSIAHTVTISNSTVCVHLYVMCSICNVVYISMVFWLVRYSYYIVVVLFTHPSFGISFLSFQMLFIKSHFIGIVSQLYIKSYVLHKHIGIYSVYVCVLYASMPEHIR